MTKTFTPKKETSTNIPKNSLKPFFQVVIFKLGENFDFEKLQRRISIGIKKADKRNKHIRLENAEIQDDTLIMHVVLKKIPSWLSNRHISKSREVLPLEDLSNELVLIYPCDGYLFTYATDDTVNSIILEVISKFDDTEIKQISQREIYKILYYKDPEIRTLGIKNIFGSGVRGSAPEAKTYFHKDTEKCLTRTFDSGYGFSYCLSRDQDSAFGCSPKKRKVWTMWSHGLDAFEEECQQLAAILNNKSAPDPGLKMLLKPADIQDYSALKPVAFFMDYNSYEKGMVILSEEGEYFPDWSCYLSENHKSEVEILLKEEKNPVRISYSLDEQDKSWKFSAVSDCDNLKTININENEEEDLDKKRGRNIIDYLNRNNNFTIIFQDGIAYRDGEYWQDNRFDLTYKDSEDKLISWNGVDITAESRSPRPGHITIIDQIVEKLKNDPEVLALIVDDGANEIADVIAIKRDKFVLIHSKASSRVSPGLRVNDMQVVVSQALKNIPFFWMAKYDKHRFERLHQGLVYPDGSKKSTHNELQTLITETLQNPDTYRECWIVQPGISKKLLEGKSKKHRIHSLLNFTDGICRSSNLKFRFICHPG